MSNGSATVVFTHDGAPVHCYPPSFDLRKPDGSGEWLQKMMITSLPGPDATNPGWLGRAWVFNWGPALPSFWTGVTRPAPGTPQGIILDRLVAMRPAIRTNLWTPPAPPSPAPAPRIDDPTDPPRSFYRIREFPYDSNYDGVFDHIQMAQPNGNVFDLDNDNDGIPNAYDNNDSNPTIGGDLLINEFLADNDNGLTASDGKRYDWVEIYNATLQPIDLAGYKIVYEDNKTSRNRTFVFPPNSTARPTVIESNAYKLLLCVDIPALALALPELASDINIRASNFLRVALRSPTDGPMGAEYRRISPYTEYLGEQYRDISFGRYPDPYTGTLSFRYFQTPTPLARNSVTGFFGVLEAPTITSPGMFSRVCIPSFPIQILGSGHLHYTLNGNVPDIYSPEYTEPNYIVADRTMVIRARAFQEGLIPSPVSTSTTICKESVLGEPGAGSVTGYQDHYALVASGWPTTTEGSLFIYPEGATGAEYNFRKAAAATDAIIHYSAQLRSPANTDFLAPYLTTRYTDLYEKLGPDACTQSFTDTTVVCITCPVSDLFRYETHGIYAAGLKNNRAPDPLGTDWEREGHVAMYGPWGEISAPCGVSIAGDASTNNWRTAKHGLRLAFRAKYGASNLSTAIFGSQIDFDNLMLRDASQDGWSMGGAIGHPVYIPQSSTFIKEGVAHRLHAAMGVGDADQPLVAQQRWAQVYLNGLFWGLYQLSERADADLYSRQLGNGDFRVLVPDLNTGLSVQAEDPGSARATEALADWAAFQTACTAVRAAATQPEKTTAYAAVLPYLDAADYTDYILVNLFMDHWDWLNNNWRAARDRTATPGSRSAKYHFMVWDIENSMRRDTYFAALDPFKLPIAGDPNVGILQKFEALTPQQRLADVAKPFMDLKGCDPFRQVVAERLRKHFGLGGTFYTSAGTSPARQIWIEEAAEYAQYHPLEAMRWGATRMISHAALNTPLTTIIPESQLTGATNWFRDQWFATRAAALTTAFAKQGLILQPLAPLLPATGAVSAGTNLTITAPPLDYTPPGTTYTYQIRYTTDGTDPATSATAISVSSPAVVVISAATTVRARTSVLDVISPESTANYTINP